MIVGNSRIAFTTAASADKTETIVQSILITTDSSARLVLLAADVN